MVVRTKSKTPITTNNQNTENNERTFWLLLVAIGKYDDHHHLSPLPYAVEDCSELKLALENATQGFTCIKQFIHHAQALSTKLDVVLASLNEIVVSAQEKDTVFVYFSGHGILEKETQQVVLCLKNTQTNDLLNTGLTVQKLLQYLGNCAAQEQMIVLDACHSGGWIDSPIQAIEEILEKLDTKKKFFCALLSCEREQVSLKFESLGHGLFTYNLIQGLGGKAGNADEIEIYALYQYIYHQTLQYIDKVNQQNRLINQIRIKNGNTDCLKIHQPQTPKLIIKAVGELVLNLKTTATVDKPTRKALITERYFSYQGDLIDILSNKGSFEIVNLPLDSQDIELFIQNFLLVSDKNNSVSPKIINEKSTVLLYLQGKITGKDNEFLLLDNGVKISCYWLKKQLHQSPITQQIVILDCVGAENLSDWLQELKKESHFNQCLIAGVVTTEQSEEFSLALLNVLKNTSNTNGFTAANWITEIQKQLIENKIWRDFFLWSSQGVIEILPPLDEVSQTQPTAVCPYKGLQAFEVKDAKFFYGREILTQRLINTISKESFLAVVGASGSGKSSLVQAGLIAQLKQGYCLPYSNQWLIKVLRPGAHPLQALTKIMIETEKESEKELQSQELGQVLDNKKDTGKGIEYLGWEGFTKWLFSRTEPVIMLVIDQFEELFTLVAESDIQEREQFLDICLQALENYEYKFKLVITLRADFISSCLQIRKLYEKYEKSHVSVPPTLDDYRKVIVEPAKKVGLEVEEDLVKKLLEELNDNPGNLPILEFVLQQLWENRKECRLTKDSYDLVIGGFKGALDRRADAIYNQLTQEQKACAQWIFLKLTKLGEGTEDTRNRVSKSSLLKGKYEQNLVEETLKILSDNRLIVMDGQEFETKNTVSDSVSITKINKPNKITKWLNLLRKKSHKSLPLETVKSLKNDITVEVAHEFLISNWQTLRKWLNENRPLLREWAEITSKASEWKKKDEKADFLLRGKLLNNALEIYLEDNDLLTTTEKQYIEASKKAQDRIRFTIGIISFIILAVIGVSGYLTWLERQNSKDQQLMSYASSNVITPDNAKAILDVLPNYLKKAHKSQISGQVNEAIADYREIVSISNNLGQEIDEKPKDYPDIVGKKAQIREILHTSSSALSKMIKEFRLPKVRQYLEEGNFGEFAGDDYSNFDNYPDSAIKETYAILMGDIGVKADKDNNGYLTEGEEDEIPCQTLKDIEDLWRSFTNQRCGFFSSDSIYDALECKELNGLTLTVKLSFQPYRYLLEKRLKQCQIIPEKLKN